MTTIDFTCSKPGENSVAVSSAGLPIDNSVTINGDSDLSKFIQFNDSGCVYSIELIENPTVGSVFSYTIRVEGRGPKGISSGKGYLYFTDGSGDTYELTLYRSGKHEHVVDFNSRDPIITTITWANKSK